MERSQSDLEKLLLKEFEPLRSIKSLATVTLMTYDVPIPVTNETLTKLKLEPDGWKIVTSENLHEFLQNYYLATGEELIATMKKTKDLHRIAGSEFTTEHTIIDLTPQIHGIAVIPAGEANGKIKEYDELTNFVNANAENLILDLTNRLSSRTQIHRIHSIGIPPIILSFYQEGKRSMVLIKDDLKVNTPWELINSLEEPSLLLVDARDIINESFKNTTLDILKSKKSHLVVGLGADVLLPKVIGQIKELVNAASGEIVFAGNRAEVKTLLENWDGVLNISELMLETNIRLLLETDGQNGATGYSRVGREIYPITQLIPIDKRSKKDTTNAGDDFQGRILAALIAGCNPSEALLSAVDGTFNFIEERSKTTLTNKVIE